jgi:hypothetical protein
LLAEGGQAQQPNLPQIPQGLGSPIQQGMPVGPQTPPQGMPPGMPLSNPAQQASGMIPNLGVRSGMGGMLSDKLARIGGQAPTPPINPVVETFDNAPPIVREAIRRRLFTQGM